MNAIQTLEFNALEHLVRNGSQPDNPPLLEKYLIKAQCKTVSSADARRQLLKRVFHTLMDTVCDTYVAGHWRHLCLDNIYKPLLAIEKLSASKQDKADYLKIRSELNTLSRYFL